MFEWRSCGNGTQGPPLRRLGAHQPRRARGELLLIRRLPDRGKNQYTFYLCHAPEGRPATLTYFITIAGRRWPVETTFRTGRICVRVGPVPGPHLERDQPAHRPDRPRPDQGHRRPVRPRRRAPRSSGSRPRRRARHGENHRNRTDLQIYTGGTLLPVTGGQPCPPGIPPIALSAAETGRLERLAREWKEDRLSRARLAFHLRWSAWRRRHQARARWHHYSTRLTALAA